METRDYLRMLKDEIHSTVFATIDEHGFPQARVIDIMLVDDNSLYFITAKGKEFYHQLMQKQYVAISGVTVGESSLNKKAISLRGKVRNVGQELLHKVFEVNTYMHDIYPTKESRMALEVFQLYEGQGEYFDLSTKPITRDSFALGKKVEIKGGYFVTDKCRGCKICYSKCPQKCIDISVKPVVINQENCLHCGNCISVCPFGAVRKRERI
ncbi:4Fe-4S binding protein [Inconstantimicrobium mannanitabidum]|uniref:Uncharacterized protein n=1 Tax=Inconstantimicrobium mannanitabidum TaxID=1604901 RepID=A0ACB5RDW9_9CLOT|nr:4Fe-4S binding protein [Clostridium sp. TW13]GKX66977.1 hypothetical protein rsdtw13_22350 [Clostridium sp. TW13]